jgi:steroid delta-isomerase-like uncharacterized protein
MSMTMTEQTLIAAARGAVAAFNAGDWHAYEAALTTDSVYDEVGTSRRIEGVAAIIPSMQAWKEAFPDVKGTVDRAFADGNTVVLEMTWTGTHSGQLQGPGGAIPASGRQQTTRTSWVLTFDGDKITESRHYFDMLSMLQQLGVIPVPEAAPA